MVKGQKPREVDLSDYFSKVIAKNGIETQIEKLKDKRLEKTKDIDAELRRHRSSLRKLNRELSGIEKNVVNMAEGGNEIDAKIKIKKIDEY